MTIKTLLFFCVSIMNFCIMPLCHAQQTIGLGQADGVIVTTSSSSNATQGANTISSEGYLPNLNAASRFLAQAAFGGSYEDIQIVAAIGIEDWIDQQYDLSRPYSIMSKVVGYQDYKNTNDPDPNDVGAYDYYFDFALWNYLMTSGDVLRQRIALALTEFFVISRFSGFGDSAYAFGTYYDMLLDNSFGNYRDLLENVTFHPAMGQYLTFMNNPKTDVNAGTFPDENYAREVMQLFSIGLCELNPDGSCQTDTDGNPLPTYDNSDISEFAKIFTGFTWHDAYDFFEGPEDYEQTYYNRMRIDEEWHESGIKTLLNEQSTNPNFTGPQDVAFALDNLFNHDNVGPFFGKFMIQRLVTSNPSPVYVERVTQAFNGRSKYGNVRGDMKALIKAILLDDEARSCFEADDNTYGMLREPFNRYVQIAKSFDYNTESGEFRNALYEVYNYIAQKPFNSPSVFNFFQSDFKPLGRIGEADKVAPEFQITNTETIAGYFRGLNRWLINDQIADEWSIYAGEDYDSYADERGDLDLSDEISLAEDDHTIPLLLDRLNLILAHGKLTQPTIDVITEALTAFKILSQDCYNGCLPYCAPPGDQYHDPNCNPNEPDAYCVSFCESENANSRQIRARIAIYLVMSSPEYLINR